MHRGYIKLWRKIQDSFIYQDSEALHLWIHLLLEANHKDKEFMFNGKKQVCSRGQILIGRKSISQKTKINQNKIYRLLEIFEKERLIEQQKTNRFTLVSIVCYEQYQSSEQQVNNRNLICNSLENNNLKNDIDDDSKNRKTTTKQHQNEQQNSDDEPCKNEQPVNNKRTTSEQQVNTNKNDKNDKNEEEAPPPSFSSFLKNLKSNPNYSHIDIDAELSKMDEWLNNHPKSKKTRTFIINWLNRIEIPFETLNPQSDFQKFCQQQGEEL